MEIAVIGDRHTVCGFKLAGIGKTFRMEDLREAGVRAVLRELFDGTVGIILVTEKTAVEIGDVLDEVNRFRTGIMPIILEIPDSSGPLISKSDPMREIIKRTVGFEIA